MLLPGQAWAELRTEILACKQSRIFWVQILALHYQAVTLGKFFHVCASALSSIKMGRILVSSSQDGREAQMDVNVRAYRLGKYLEHTHCISIFCYYCDHRHGETRFENSEIRSGGF